MNKDIYKWFLEEDIDPFLLEILLATKQIKEVEPLQWRDGFRRRFRVPEYIADQFDCFNVWPVWEPTKDHYKSSRAKR